MLESTTPASPTPAIHSHRLRDTRASPYAWLPRTIAKARGRVMLRGALAALAALALSASAGAAQTLHPLPPQPAGVPWPTQGWESAPLPADVDRAAFDLAVTEAFAGLHPRMHETRAVVIVQGGRIVFERYMDGYT